MGMYREATQMFQSVSYNRIASPELRTAMQNKIIAVTAKIEERRGRIARIMSENKISDAALGDMIIQYMKDRERGASTMMYSSSNAPSSPGAAPTEVMIPAGVVSNLVTEKELIEAERAQVDRMNMILRNLKDLENAYSPTTGEVISRIAIHKLADEELIYLGF